MQGFRAHLARDLFPDPLAERPRLSPLWKLLLGVALVGLAILLQLARLGWSASLHSLWAEDGPIYMQAALTHGFWDAVTSTYATYLVVVPRLIAEGASLAPLEDVPAAVSVLSGAVVAAAGLIVWYATGAHIHNPFLRGALALLTVLSPVAGLESVDSAAYVPWYLLFASFWILLWRPLTVRGTVFAAAFLLLTGLSTPGGWFFAPLAALRLLAARDWRDATILAGYAIGAAAQVPVLALTDETAVQPIWTHDIWTSYLQRVIDGAPFGLHLSEAIWIHLGWPLLIVVTVSMIAGFAIGFREAGAGARWIAGVALPTSLVMFVVSLYQRAVGEQMVWPIGASNAGGSRYAIVPALLVVSAALVLIDSAERRRPSLSRRVRPSMAALAILAVALATSFYLRDIAVRGVPPWTAALEGAAKECAIKGDDEIAIQTSPPGFGMQLPCDELTSFSPASR